MARVGLDVDSVIYPFTERFRKYVQNYSIEKLSEPVTWEFYRDWDWEDEDFLFWHQRFVEDNQYSYGGLIGGAETRIAIQKLRDAGHEIILVTARHTVDDQQGMIEEQTKEWLDWHSIKYDELHFERDKTKIDLDYFLDDRYENYDALWWSGLQSGSFLLDQPWNREQRVDGMDNVVRSVEAYADKVLDPNLARCLVRSPSKTFETRSAGQICEDLNRTTKTIVSESTPENTVMMGDFGKGWTEIGYVDETGWKPERDMEELRSEVNMSLASMALATNSYTFTVDRDYDPELLKAIFGFDYYESENESSVSDNTDFWTNEREDVLARFAYELRKATGDGSKKRQSGEKPPWFLDGAHEPAIFSHLNKWKHGEIIDPDSGAHTLVHLAWRALAIACQETGNTPDLMKEIA